MLHRLPLLTVSRAAALALSLAGCARPSTASAPAVSSGEVLRVPLSTLDGEPTDLARAARGSVTVVALWATWCDACRKELPALARLNAKAQARGDFRVVAVAVGDDRAAVSAFVKEHGLGFARLVDDDYALANGLQSNRVPTTVVFDREGRIVYQGGALDRPALEALRAALPERP